MKWASMSLRASEKNAEKVDRLLDDLEETFGPSLMTCRLREETAKQRGRKDLAAEARLRAAALAPRTAWEHYALGRAFLVEGKLDEARLCLERALRLQPDSYWANFHQGVCAYRQKDYPEALAAFRACLALSPGNAQCLHNRGLTYEALGESDKARQDLAEARKLDPSLPEIDGR